MLITSKCRSRQDHHDASTFGQHVFFAAVHTCGTQGSLYKLRLAGSSRGTWEHNTATRIAPYFKVSLAMRTRRLLCSSAWRRASAALLRVGSGGGRKEPTGQSCAQTSQQYTFAGQPTCLQTDHASTGGTLRPADQNTDQSLSVVPIPSALLERLAPSQQHCVNSLAGLTYVLKRRCHVPLCLGLQARWHKEKQLRVGSTDFLHRS